MALLSIAKNAKLIGFDVDEKMMDKARLQLATKIDENGQKLLDVASRIDFFHGNYADIGVVLA